MSLQTSVTPTKPLQSLVISTEAQRSGETRGNELTSGEPRGNELLIFSPSGLVLSQRSGKICISDQPQPSVARQKAARFQTLYAATLALLFCMPSVPVQAATPSTKHNVSGAHILQLTEQLLAAAPKRYIGSPGHMAAESFIKAHFAPEIAKGNFVADSFTAMTPIGQLPMTNYIVKFPSTNAAKRDGIIAFVSHYETNYPLKDVAFVGANDGACTSALLIALGEYYRAHPPTGNSVWLVFDDGEEAIRSWTASDSLYGTRHLAAKWAGDGTLPHLKAVAIADMIGDKDLNIMEESRSTPWLTEALRTAAKNTGHTANVFRTQGAEEDDHTPFLARGIPTIDMIDADYGPHTPELPDGYHHTPQDTIDKLSAASLQTSADLFLELARQVDAR